MGYGDLSVAPFTTTASSIDAYHAGKFPCTEGGILTPNLERMARRGIVLTNFHSASPVRTRIRSKARNPTFLISFSSGVLAVACGHHDGALPPPVERPQRVRAGPRPDPTQRLPTTGVFCPAPTSPLPTQAPAPPRLCVMHALLFIHVARCRRARRCFGRRATTRCTAASGTWAGCGRSSGGTAWTATTAPAPAPTRYSTKPRIVKTGLLPHLTFLVIAPPSWVVTYVNSTGSRSTRARWTARSPRAIRFCCAARTTAATCTPRATATCSRTTCPCPSRSALTARRTSCPTARPGTPSRPSERATPRVRASRGSCRYPFAPYNCTPLLLSSFFLPFCRCSGVVQRPPRAVGNDHHRGAPVHRVARRRRQPLAQPPLPAGPRDHGGGPHVAA